MSEPLILLVGTFLGLMLVGLPVAWSMVAAMLGWVAFTGNWRFLPIAPERVWQGMDSFVLMAVPLFILAGELVNAGKITDRLVHFANVVFGWMRGGLAQVNIGASILFSGITGVALGDIAALGRVFIPAMVAQGYTPAYAAAVTASSSIIGPMVPPSLVAVIYGSMTGLSIGGLMAATLLPGLVIGLVQMALVAVQARRHDFPRVEMVRTPAVVMSSARGAMVPLMIPVIILAGLLGGLMTPTEAGAVASAYALVVSVVLYRSIRLREIGAVFQRSALFSGQLLIIVGCGSAFSWVMGMENVPRMVAGVIGGWDIGYVGTLLTFNAILLVLGMFIDGVAMIVLTAPLLFPIATRLGIDPIHFAVIMVANVEIATLTPPIGLNLFVMSGITKLPVHEVVRGVMPFYVVRLLALMLISYIPSISLVLIR